MFVDISDYKSALAVENILMPYKKGRLSSDKKMRLPKEKITPQVCMDVLRSTNYARNIRDMLLCIAELPKAEQAQFKDVVLATFVGREQSTEIVELGRELARSSGFETKFNEAENEKFAFYLASAPQRSIVFKTDEGNLFGMDFSSYDKLICKTDKVLYLGWSTDPDSDDYTPPVTLPPVIEAPKCPVVNFGEDSCCDGTKLRKLILAEGGAVYIQGVNPLPEQLEISDCEKIVVGNRDMALYQNWKYRPDALFYRSSIETFSGLVDFSGFGGIDISSCDFEPSTQIKLREGAKIHIHCQPSVFLPDNLDVSASPDVSLRVDDLSNLDKLKFQKDATVTLSEVKKFPPNLDFSECSSVVMNFCDVADVQKLEFKNGAKVKLWRVENLPADLDVSCCDDVEIDMSDVSKMKDLRFKDGAKVKLLRVTGLPGDLDVSCCDNVEIDASDLSRVKNLRFKNGAKVKLLNIKQLPENLDFSQCDEVDLSGTDLRNLKSIRFKKGAKVKLCNAANLPPNIDFSQCAELNLICCDLKDQSQMKFADGAKVKLTKATNLHGNGDFSNCDVVNLGRVDLKDLEGLKFKAGARVILNVAQNIPLNADFSNCAFLSAQYCELKNLSCIRFAEGAEVDLSHTNSLPEIVDVSACQKVDLTSANEKYTRKFIFKDAQQLEQSNIRLSSSQKFKAVILENLSEDERKALLSQLQVSEKLNRQNAQNHIANAATGSEKDNRFGWGNLWNKLFGNDGK